MILTEKYETVINENDLFEQYNITKDIEIRNQIIERYSYIVKIIALKFRSIYQQFGDVDDIVNEGIIALIDVVDKYDLSKNTKFETYASIRIKGAIIDYVRKQDWVPRKVKRDYKTVREAEEVLYNKLGREPRDVEIAEYLKLDMDKYNNIVFNAHGTSVLSFEELLGESNIKDNVNSNIFNLPEQEIETQELQKVLIESIDKLNKKEKLVISLYYKEDIKLKDIADIMEISNSRVSQIHTSALQKLEKSIQSYMQGNKIKQ